MSEHHFRLFIAFIFACIIAVCCVGSLESSVEAQTATPTKPPWFDPVTAAEKRVFEEIVKRSYQQPVTAQTQTAREIFARQTARAVPRLAPRLIARGGLPLAAAATWTVVGLELYFLPCWECGTESIEINQDVRLAPGAVVSRRVSSNGSEEAYTVVTYYGANRSAAGDVTADVYASYYVTKFRTTNYSNGKQIITAGVENPSVRVTNNGPIVSTAVTTAFGGSLQPAPAPTPPSYATQKGDHRAVNSRAQIDLQLFGSSASPKMLCAFAPSGSSAANCSGFVTPPTVEYGAANGSNPSITETLTPTESNQLINQVVADPETPGVVDPMDVPEPEVDPNWDPNTDPFSPIHNPFEEPQGDPDVDGIPNETDPDPEGDGDPDGDGDPNEHPMTAPNPDPAEDPEGDGDTDGDGSPNETSPPPVQQPDTDDDGIPDDDDADDDGDGIPDEDDPNPTTPTDPNILPQDHPYADPDEDGQPNREDEDDDGDGIPDESDPDPHAPTEDDDLPLWHPFADPDGDGSRNGQDKDDDGDEAEDWEDERPFSPAVPSDPDRDTDDDGTPDWSDPWPGNPWAPHDPDRDDDQDGTPDYKDPDPDRDNVPWGPWPDPDDDPDDPPERKDRPDDDPDTGTGTPWRDPDTGTPNVPTNPPNTAYPPGSPATSNPPDQSTGIDNPPPTSSDTPDDPTTETPNDPPTDGGGEVPPKGPLFACPVDPQNTLIVPPIDFEEKFPFSLILGAISVLDQLVGTPQAPVFELPMIGTQDLSRFDGVMSVMRTVWLVFLGGILMPIMFYRLIKGGGE